jgi:NAD(P)-dependent dehydrogenase (short-subunit alcohol dehydrogenase family)
MQNRNAKFVKCDVCSWDSQLAMFKAARVSSPEQSIDIVVANAGITGPDPVFYGQGQFVPLPKRCGPTKMAH